MQNSFARSFNEKKKQDKLKPEKQTVVTLRDVRIVKETLMNSDHTHNETYIIQAFYYGKLFIPKTVDASILQPHASSGLYYYIII